MGERRSECWRSRHKRPNNVQMISFWWQNRGNLIRQNTKNRPVFASGSGFGVVFGVDE